MIFREDLDRPRFCLQYPGLYFSQDTEAPQFCDPWDHNILVLMSIRSQRRLAVTSLAAKSLLDPDTHPHLSERFSHPHLHPPICILHQDSQKYSLFLEFFTHISSLLCHPRTSHFQLLGSLCSCQLEGTCFTNNMRLVH